MCSYLTSIIVFTLIIVSKLRVYRIVMRLSKKRTKLWFNESRRNLATDIDRTLLEKLNLIWNVMMYIDDASKMRKVLRDSPISIL